MTGRRSDEAAEELVPLPVDHASPAGRPATDRAGLDRSGRAIGLGALLIGLVFAGALTGIDQGDGAIFQPSTGTWERIPHPQSLAETPVWTGQDALFWVGRFEGSADGVWLYRPQLS